MKKLLSIYIISITFITGNISQAQIAAWDFTGENSVETSSAEIFNGNMDASNLITRGTNASASSGSNSFRTTGFKNDGISLSNSDYFQITLSASPGFTLSLSTIDAHFNGTASFYASPGVTSQFAYSIDGTNFTLIGSPTTSTSLTMDQIDLTGITELQNVDASVTITIRYYASGQTATGGWGFYSSSTGQYGLAVGGFLTSLGGTPTKLAITSINGGLNPSVNTSFDITIQAQDDSNIPQNVSANTDFSLSLASGNGSLGGTLTGTIPAGSNGVTISGVTYNTAETNVSITATRTSGDILTAGTSSIFNVLEAASELAFVNVPSAGQQNVSLGTFTVEARRADNSVDLNFTGNISIDKNSGPGNISGTIIQNAVAGVATFNNISFDAEGTYTISANSTGLTGTTSNGITILSTALPLVEEFNYTPGSTLLSNGWAAANAGGTNSILVSSGALIYSGYASSGSGNKVTLSGSGEDVYRTFDQVSSNSIYAAFLVNVSSATSTGDYFLSLSTNNAGSYFARIFAKDNGSGNLVIGISKNSTSPIYASNIYEFNTTHLIVVKYTFNSSSNDDTTGIFIDPDVSGDEPVSFDAEGITSENDAGGIGSILLRQGSTTNAPNLSLSGIRIGITWGDLPLPVELISFSASVVDAHVNLKWSTATEVNNYGFEVERKNGSSEVWNKIAFIKGNGNSNSPKNYYYVDENVTSGKYYYRLKQTDFDGKFNFSKAVEVNISNPEVYKLNQNYPNPFNPVTNIKYEIPKAGKVRLVIFDMLGRKLQTLVNEYQNAGRYNIQYNAGKLASGTYFYEIQSGNYIEVKKMILLK